MLYDLRLENPLYVKRFLVIFPLWDVRTGRRPEHSPLMYSSKFFFQRWREAVTVVAKLSIREKG